MKPRKAKQAREKEPTLSITNQREETASIGKLSRQARPPFDDVRARITARAYELYVERGYRHGCGLEDWLDAEREILSRASPT